jgi:hypothetical protein
MPGRIDHDPIEDDPAFKVRIAKANKEAEKAVKQVKKGQRGYCHAFWAAKKRILHEKYGIDWKDPSDLNPTVRFD